MAVTTREQLKQYALRAQWVPRWYYIMENKTSGKLYIGQTKRDINSYLGSGVYWVNHCKSHGGYTSENITVLHKWWIEDEELAELLLVEFHDKEGEYWLNENKKWANQVPEDTSDNPFFKNGREIGKRELAKMLENGTHPFLKHNVTDKIRATYINSEKAKKFNAVMIAEGTHPLLEKNLNKDFIERRNKRIKNLTRWQLENGLHSSTNEESIRKIGIKNKIHNDKKVAAGTHHYIGGFYAINKKGEIVKISSEEYKSQTGDKDSWEYVHPTSTEGKKRRGLQ